MPFRAHSQYNTTSAMEYYRYYGTMLMMLLLAVVQTGIGLPLRFGSLDVWREVGSLGDRFRPSQNDLADEQFCERFTNATSVANGEEDAFCLCDEETPIFDQATASCRSSFVDNDACKTSIQFNGPASDATYFERHRLYLPLLGQTVNTNYQLDWRGAKVARDQMGFVNCRIGQTSTLTESGGWRVTSPPLKPGIFRLVNESSTTKLKYNGDDNASAFLTGKQITLTVHCPRTTPIPFFCIQFSVHGKDNGQSFRSTSLSASDPTGTAPVSESAVDVDGGIGGRPGDIIAIICAILLLLTIVGTAMLWVICWRYHKDKLARRIQMQMIYQQRIQASQIYNDFARNNQTYFSGLDIQMQQGGMEHVVDTGVVPGTSSYHLEMYNPDGMDGPMVNPPPPYPSKKKLFFSPEFFEPEMMETPPPVAEEFLYEVRRMIDVAKTRIRSRRYLPNLHDIPEERSSTSSTYDPNDHPSSMETSIDLELTCSLSNSNDDAIMEDIEESSSPNDNGRQQTSSPGHSSGHSQPTSSDSHDSGFASPSKNECKQKQDKVKHWLDKLPEEIEMEESTNATDIDSNRKLRGAAISTKPCRNDLSDSDSDTAIQRKFPSTPGASNNSAMYNGCRSGNGTAGGGGIRRYLHAKSTTASPTSTTNSSPMSSTAIHNHNNNNNNNKNNNMNLINNNNLKSSALLRRYGIGPNENYPTLKTTKSGAPQSMVMDDDEDMMPPSPAQTPLVRTLGASPVYRPVY